ncbi:uncharacterized protein [Spinacia oleracea]|uniref:Uncharacterized protein isoform X1 n=1 Tax=Spinacia oleracea TaxID=3562 RepID=A0ABM3R7L0_SPIOL|nr:uncharacterized protein LOC130467191 isoform X1 [Spinacia oleracea]
MRGNASSALCSEYFNSKPYACDPSTFPIYPPNKEIDAKGRDDARSNTSEMNDLKAGAELLDIILSKLQHNLREGKHTWVAPIRISGYSCFPHCLFGFSATKLCCCCCCSLCSAAAAAAA